jgi:uncharacterized protein (DUF924 family)
LAQRWEEILDFWFGDLSAPDYPPREQSQLWFGKSERSDNIVRERFSRDLARAAQGECGDWGSDPRGRLSLILLFDQFPRMIYRDTPQAFAYDEYAQALVLEGIKLCQDSALNPFERLFFYLPLEHAENLDLQHRSVEAFRDLVAAASQEHRGKVAGYLDYAIRHFEVIERFGRFPHRNRILNRASSAEEVLYLREPGTLF